MTARDIRHYKFLRRAIEFKYRFPDQSAFETFSYDPYIFRWASNTFYELKLFDYLDIRERAVLVRLYENLKKDPRLKFLDDPDSLKNKIEFKLPESFHVKIASEQAAPSGGTVAQSAQPASGRGPTFRPPASPSVASVSKVNVRPPRVSFGAGNILRNMGSQSSIFLKKNVFGKILTPTRLVTGFTTILGGIVGSGLGPIGTLAGAGAGFLAPSYVKTFGTRHLTNFAHWGADSMVRLSSQTSRFSAGGFGGRGVTGKRVAIAAILLFFGVGALAAFAPLPGQQTPPAAAAPVGPVNIATCQFTRGNRTPAAESYKSLTLLSYFQQASQISSVPAVVLAAIARVESPTITSKTDADLPYLNSIAGCPRSQTGALGIMQIQPPGTRGYIQSAVEKGASYLGKTAQNLTEADFCDLRSNIIIASGFILKKLQLGFSIGDGNKWDPSWTDNRDVIYKLAEGYYGCLEYGDPDPLKCGGPYNYGDDIWTSIQNCKISRFAASCPVPGGQIKTSSYQASSTTGHCSPSYGSCPAESRRAKSVDVDTQGQEVIFPTINGQKVEWVYLNEFSLDKPSDCEGGLSSCGKGYVFQAQSGSDNWVLHLLHLDPNRLFFRLRGVNESGFPVGTTVPGVFLHIDIGRNITNPSNPPQGDMDFDPGWIPPDFMCQ